MHYQTPEGRVLAPPAPPHPSERACLGHSSAGLSVDAWVVNNSPLKECSSTCSWWGMVKLPPFGWMLGMSSLQVEPEKIVRKSPYFA
jgi:hypothetical protein